MNFIFDFDGEHFSGFTFFEKIRDATLWLLYPMFLTCPIFDFQYRQNSAKIGQTHLGDLLAFMGPFYGNFMEMIGLKAPGNYSAPF